MLHGGFHRIREPLPEPCARLEIGEDEREGLGRGVTHLGACLLRAEALQRYCNPGSAKHVVMGAEKPQTASLERF